MDSTKKYRFDDEKGNNFNITVNHYHSVAPRSPMESLGDMIAQTMMTRVLCDAFSKNNNEMIEDDRNIRVLPKNEILIEDRSNEIQYEIHDDIENYEFEVLSMVEKFDILILKINFIDKMNFNIFVNHFFEIGESVKRKLSMLNSKNYKFTFEFDIENIGKVVCGYVSSDYYTALIKKFGNGKDRVSFNRSIAEKLNVPFIEILSNLDFIIDTESLFKIKFESIDSKYHLSKEGEKNGY